MEQENVDRCLRKKVTIEGEDYYIIQGRYKVQVTVPRENSPERYKERKSVDILCQEVLNMANRLNQQESKQ